MPDAKQLFDEMRQTQMNDWVGGADPQTVGEASCNILERYMPIDGNSHLLDFGCGVGRVLVSLLDRKPGTARITGFDIMPQVIEFCNRHIATALPQSSFELIQGRNDHYDRFVSLADNTAAKSRTSIEREYESAFTGAYAFSVFTHVEAVEFQAMLGLLARLIQPGATCLLTAFLLTEHSRRAIRRGSCLFSFNETAYEAGGNVFIGNVADRLGFVAFDLAVVQRMVLDAGLTLTNLEFGSWAGAGFSSSLQDVIVCRRPFKQGALIENNNGVARPWAKWKDLVRFGLGPLRRQSLVLANLPPANIEAA